MVPDPRTRVDAMGEVTWANASGRVIVRFTQIGQQTRNQLKESLLVNLQANVSNSSSGSSMFRAANHDKRDSDLISSTDVQAGSSSHWHAERCSSSAQCSVAETCAEVAPLRSAESSCTDVTYIGKLIVMLVFPEAYRKLQIKVLTVTGSRRLRPTSSARKVLTTPSFRQKSTKLAGRGFFNGQERSAAKVQDVSWGCAIKGSS
jgi:hypothetical protein